MSTPQFTLDYDTWGRLVLTDERQERHVGVVPVRLFPMSNRNVWWSILDSGGRELFWIADPHQLPAKTRELLENDLAAREFTPVIQRIVHVSGNMEPCEWQVETDRGATKFVLKSEDDVRRLGPNRVLVIDANGLRYLIADEHALDASSRRIVEWYV